LKKIITISFLFILFFSQIGYAVVTMIQRYHIKQQVEKQLLATISENELQVIDAELNKKAIVWEEEGKEFSMDGQLYDVAKIKNENGKTLIYCLNDVKEEQLLEKYSKAVQSATDQNSSRNGGDHIVKFQLADCLLFNAQVLNSIPQTVPQKYFVFNDKVISSYKEITTPPPRFDYIHFKQNFL